MKFKIGDLVTIPNRSTRTDLMADAIGDLQDGLITYAQKEALDSRMCCNDPMRIHAIEGQGKDRGYILGLPKGRKGLTGVMYDQDLQLFKK